MSINEDTEEIIVACKNLWKVYGPDPHRYVVHQRDGREVPSGHVAAVRDLTFDVRRGEKLVIMGLSGSGKSTLIRCLTRLIEPTAGEIIIGGRDVTNMGPSELRDLRREECSMVFQHFGLFAHRNVLQNTAYGLEISRVSRQERERRAHDVLDTVGLSGWEYRFPSELSGGMKQRVGLARALASDPQILFLDEPFSALDPLIRRDLQDELLRLAKDIHKTLVFITHDMSEALKLGDRIIIMRDGQVVQIGTPEEILLHPSDDYVRRFTADASRSNIVRVGAVARDAERIKAQTSASDALDIFDASGVDFGIIIDSLDRPLGYITRSQLVAEGHNSVVTSMQMPLPSIRNDETLHDATQLLMEGDDPVAVVDSEGRFLGTIDVRLLLAALVDLPHGREESANVTPSLQEKV